MKEEKIEKLLTLSKFEESLLIAIGKGFPYTQQQVNQTYLRVEGSFDKTIKILEKSGQLSLYPSQLLDIVEELS